MRSGEIEQLVLLYSELDPPVLLAIADEPLETMSTLLAELSPALPARLYVHISPQCLPALSASRPVSGRAEPHLKLSLDSVSLPPRAPGELPGSRLGPGDTDEVEEFFRRAYPGSWFVPRMLQTERFVGVREDRALVSVAGVHVYSRQWGAAALGNVATLPEARGRGLGTAACLALCRLLARDGIPTISLNVRADNGAAIAVYRRLGFSLAAEYLEASLG